MILQIKKVSALYFYYKTLIQVTFVLCSILQLPRPSHQEEHCQATQDNSQPELGVRGRKKGVEE